MTRPRRTRWLAAACCAAVALTLSFSGCRWLKLGDASAKLNEASSPTEARITAAADAAESPRGATAATLGRDGWNPALAPQPPFPGAEGFRWRHHELETLLALEGSEAPDLSAALVGENAIAAVNAAIGLARRGDGRGRERLAKAGADGKLRRDMRCAAIEALGGLEDPAALADLRAMLERQRRGPKGTADYSPEIHAELLYSLAEHVDAAADAPFVEALKSSEVKVRLAAIRAMALAGKAALPVAAADLRSDQDHLIRAAALAAMVARRHAAALDATRAALLDYRLEVRLAAVKSLGDLGGDEARQALKRLEREPEIIRAAAVTAWAQLDARDEIWSAARNTSWRVRQAAAEALARWPDAGGAALARQLIRDPSAEVQKQMLVTLAQWPLEIAGPVLLFALEDGGYLTRKTAAAQLAERWPPAAEFTVDAPPERRAEMLSGLRKTWGESHVLTLDDESPGSEHAPGAAIAVSPERVRRAGEIVRRLQEAPPTGGAIALALHELDAFGPDLAPALERLVADEHVVLPDIVYRDVLAKRGTEFDALDRLTASAPLERQQAAAKLAEQAQRQPLSGLALARLAELGVGEQDVLVWHSMMQAVANDPREPSIRLAYAGMSHSSGEVRRLACEHLAGFRDPQFADELLLALEDQQRAVVLAAVKGLGHRGMIDDVRSLERLLGTNDRELRLAAAESLVRLGAASGGLALERLAHDADPQTRRDAAAVMGALGDPAFAGVLVGMLDDGLGVQFIALDALPKVVGRDVADDPANPATNTLERISRWKRWHEAERRKAEAGLIDAPADEKPLASAEGDGQTR